jgi:hypothetical protein
MTLVSITDNAYPGQAGTKQGHLGVLTPLDYTTHQPTRAVR